MVLRPSGKSINRAPSPMVAVVVPWLSVMLGSLLSGWVLIASAPLVPPLGYMLLLSWRQQRPGLFPVWAGLPLGLFDDLYSGQPFGSAVVIWSATMIAMELIETRFPWRSFLLDWALGAAMIAAAVLIGWFIAHVAGPGTPLRVMTPQLVVAMLFFPLAGRVVGVLDRWRLVRLRAFG